MERPVVVFTAVRVYFITEPLTYLTQTSYRHRKFPWGLSHIFLILNVIVSQVTP
jgi:hypothetical protein